MKSINLRPADLDRDFSQLADWFSYMEDEPTTEPVLKKDYQENRKSIIRLMVAEGEHGELLGFIWAVRNRIEIDRIHLYLFVKPEQRRQGIGRLLYDDAEQAAVEAKVHKVRVSVSETSPESRAFAERRGFIERLHMFMMALDMDTFDDQPYDKIIDRLKGEGFLFTTMEELGNTDEAQRKLYFLNDTASATTPGTEGEHSWESFEDFQKSVCQKNWYKPGGQVIAIDTATGDWAAMSAITRLAGDDHAYNLFTGVDTAYRGRQLGQAVKVLALRFARNVLEVNEVRTHHNTKNLPMIAIDRKFGYRQMPGDYLMEKKLVPLDISSKADTLS